MTGKEYEALREDLASLGEETPVPAMPDGLHQRWMELVKEDAMEHRNENAASPAAAEKKGFIRFTPKTRRLLAWAAALVFVVGGTLMTRDSLPARTTRVRANSSVQTATATAYDAGNANAVYEPMMVMEEAAPAAVEAAYGAAYSRAYDSAADMDMAEYETYEESAEAGETREAKIIRNVSLSMATKRFDEALTAIKTACADCGGRVSYESMNYSGSLRRVNLTLRVPAQALDSFLVGAEGAARVTSREETANDVTDSYYDTASRLETQKALMARLRSLMTETASLTELLQLESQIADTQYTIDRLQGQLNSTDSKVAESTVTISLREEKETETIVNQEASFLERIGSALKTGVTAFTDFVEDMAVFAVAALPFILLVIVAIIVIRIIKKRKRG